MGRKCFLFAFSPNPKFHLWSTAFSGLLRQPQSSDPCEWQTLPMPTYVPMTVSGLFYTTSLSHYTKPWLNVKINYSQESRISFNTYSPPHWSRHSTSSRKEVAKAMVPGFPSTHRYASRLSTTWESKSPQNNLSIPSAQTWFGVPFLWHTFSKLTTSSMRWRTNREP